VEDRVDIAAGRFDAEAEGGACLVEGGGGHAEEAEIEVPRRLLGFVPHVSWHAKFLRPGGCWGAASLKRAAAQE
jgi:hypothetical protein